MKDPGENGAKGVVRASTTTGGELSGNVLIQLTLDTCSFIGDFDVQ